MTDTPRHTRVGGVHVTIAGDPGNPRVLLLHGIGGCADSFTPQFAPLGRRYRVLAWDAPGYARSTDRPRSSSRPTLDDYAATAATVLHELDAAPAHVVGSSWGGVIATRLVLRFPALVSSLVLADSSRGSGRTVRGAAGMRQRGPDLARLGARAFARDRAKRLLSGAASQALLDQVITAMAEAIRLPGYADAAESMASTDHSADLPTISVPTLVVVGEHDTVTGAAESRAMAAAIPGARHELVAEAGHLANQENPAGFNAALETFLAGQELGPAGGPDGS